MATKRKSGGEEEGSVFEVDYLSLLGQAEKVAKLQSITLGSEMRLSTGLLSLDAIIGGGVTAGMYTFFGPEQSAKTTLAITTMGSSVNQDVGMRILWDAENSTGSSTDYVANIFNTMNVKADVETVFGVKKDGKYVVKPLVYYRDEGEAEAFFDFMSAMLRRLPDKRFEDGRWWLVYEKSNEAKAKFADVLDPKMSRDNDAIYIPAENGSLQTVVVLDSYPGLVPAGLDDDDPSGAMALQARTFSIGFQRLKGKLRRKRVALIGINQLRLNPGARFGNPEYEPGGQAIRYFSDVRLRLYPRALSGVPFNPKGEKMIEEEPSVDGKGKDRYRYINVQAQKNKLSVPNRETWLRLWVEDAEGNAHGYDPVWDTFYALALSGQVEGKRSALRLRPAGSDAIKKSIGWQQFKELVIGTKDQKLDVFKTLGVKPINLRKYIRTQMDNGKYEDLYIAHRNSKPAKGSNDED